MPRFKIFLQIRIPGGLIDHFQLLNSTNSTSQNWEENKDYSRKEQL